MRSLHFLLLIPLFSIVSSKETYPIQKADVGMVYIVEGIYEDNDKLPTIAFTTSKQIPVEVTLLGNGITQISVKEESSKTKHTEVTNKHGYSRGEHVKIVFVAHVEGGLMTIYKDHMNKRSGSEITTLLSTVPFFDLQSINTHNLANVVIKERLLSEFATEYPEN